jgi:hypothetical protein
MAKLLHVLRERGFIDQLTHEQELMEYLDQKKSNLLYRF